MNRIYASQSTSVGKSAAGEYTGAAQYTASDRACRHSLFAPLHYEPNYAYPLIVWLHGPHGDESQLKRIMPLVSLRNYAAVAPRGTQSGKSEAAGYGWRDSEDHILLAEQRVFSCIQQAERKLRISPKRIFLAGYQCGGTMAFRIALKHPQRFAGVLSFCGAFPSGLAPLGRINEARTIPVLIAAGRQGEQYAESKVSRDLRLLHYAGMSVTLRLYPCGDDLTTHMLSDMDRWIMQQICPSST